LTSLYKVNVFCNKVLFGIFIAAISFIMAYTIIISELPFAYSIGFSTIFGIATARTVLSTRKVFINSKKSDEKFNDNESNEYKTEYLAFPKELKTPIYQYLIFFKDFIRISKGELIDLKIEDTDKGLKLQIRGENIEINPLQDWFGEYIGFLKRNIDKKRIIIENKEPVNLELLKIKLENQVANLKNSIRIINFENSSLKKTNELLEKIIFTLSDREMVIKNQIITGGEQQFGNKIENK